MNLQLRLRATCIARALALVAVAALAGIATANMARADDAPPAHTIRAMTYNLRYASATGPNAWPVRRPLMAKLLREHAPDVVGTQEGLYAQLKDIEADLPEYRWIGLGRNGGSHGEFMAIFYRHERLEPLEFDHFWLSDTPDRMGSTSWGNSNRRMVTWVKFHDRQGGPDFYVWNTHFDHQIQEARDRSASLVLERLAKLPQDAPVILLGDFNSMPTSSVYKKLTGGGLTDAWTAAPKHSKAEGTFHGFAGPSAHLPRIDWILFRGPYHVQSAEVILDGEKRQYPSDHFPVLAELELLSTNGSPMAPLETN